MKFSEITEQQFEKFKNILEEHYFEEGNLFTEDLIRYWFIKFFQDIGQKKDRGSTLIEEPYLRGDKTKLKLKQNTNLKIDEKGNNRYRADLYYLDNDEVFEFKYHRKTKYSESCTGTYLGSLINDFNRLSILDNKKKYSIYVFDQKMKNYFDNSKHAGKFDFVNYDNINFDKDYIIPDYLYGTNGLKEILINAFASFYDKSHYVDSHKNDYNFSRFNYKIKVLYKALIQDNYYEDKQNNLYIMIYEIV